MAMLICRKELLVLLIDQKRNPPKTSKVLVTDMNGSGRNIRMELNYLNIIRRQIFVPLRCVALFIPNLRKWPHFRRKARDAKV
jgi:cell division FtsZ-interacting protein ZapD